MKFHRQDEKCTHRGSPFSKISFSTSSSVFYLTSLSSEIQNADKLSVPGRWQKK